MKIQKAEDYYQSGRERETLFRSSYRNQTNLRQIIDRKANMIISINTLIISSIIAISGYGVITDKLELYRFNIIFPIVIIVVSSLISAILAILAALPKIIHSEFKNSHSERQSLLFFGVIAEYSQKEYIEKMEELLNSRKQIYEHMIIDLYSQGIILKQKYNLLGYAYQVLMYGFGLGVVAFLIFLFFTSDNL
jgi:hypothetical protein